MIFDPPADLELELSAIEQIDDLRRQLRHRVAEPRRWLGGLRRLTFARAVQGSNSIEGYNASVDDVMAVVADEEALGTTTETRLALQGYRDAMTYVVALADDGDLDVDESLLRSLHYMMIKHDLAMRPGRWRHGDVFVRREPLGDIVYEGPDADLVPELVHELLARVNEHDGSVLVRAAMAHLNLVMVHPFKDGNGRMGRCLQTLVLARERIVAPVFSSIEEQLGRDTEAYYAVLGSVGGGSWHPTNDARLWVRFYINAHYAQARRALRRTRDIEELWGRCEEIVARYGLPDRAIGALCDASRGLRIQNWYYRVTVRESEGSEIDTTTAGRDLRAMVDRGLLLARGETRGRFYIGTPELQGAYASVRTGSPSGDRADLFEDRGS